MSTRVNRRQIRVEFGNCDPAEIVYFPNYLVWLDQSTHYLFESVGIPWRDLPARWAIQAPLVDVSARFLGPAFWGDDLDIESNIDSWGPKSFVVSHRIKDAKTGKCLVEGRETRVCVSFDPNTPKQLKACIVPDDIRSAFV
jgi:4-hydroxybenzoyl-CoA thioesterase